MSEKMRRNSFNIFTSINLRVILPKFLLFTSILFFYFVGLAHGQVIIKDSFYATTNRIYKEISYLKSNRDLSFNQVRHNTHFKPLITDVVPNFGLTDNSIWLRFKVKNQSKNLAGVALCVSNPLLKTADLYVVYPNGKIDTTFAGNRLPFSKRIIRTTDFVYKLPLNNTKNVTCYLKVYSDFPLTVPIAVNSLRAQFNDSAPKNAIIFTFMGIIVVMLFYHLFLALSLNDNAYWTYIIYLIFLMLSQLSLKGFSFMFLWPNHPYFNKISTIIFPNIANLSIILFTYSFLNLRKNGNRFIHTVFILLAISGLCSIIFDFFPGGKAAAFYIMQASTFMGGIVLLCVSIYLLKTTKNAAFFLLAWAVLITCSLLFILKDYNIVPDNMFMTYIVQIGAVIEIIVLSLGLANRINILKKERTLSRINELRVANENKRILSRQNETLEQQVSERTEKLEQSNGKLKLTLANLKQAQSQLVQSEKMSSLGQLTAGIAHEINNPINFVSANVTPLKRDYNQLFETLKEFETIGLKNLPTAEKAKAIEKYKEETELDYVQSEINQLLNGISEGASRTAVIVKGLKTFSKLDEEDFKPSSINEGLESTLAIAKNMMKGINLHAELNDIPLVDCFPGKLNQVFLNFISNAVYAIKEHHGGDVGGNLWVKTYAGKQTVFVSIKDDGKGMDEATKAKLFEPFYTTKPIGEGTGLGLSISYTILQQHQATCQVKSTPGKGTEFLIKLPIHPQNIKGNEKKNPS